MKSCGRIGWLVHSITAEEIAEAMLHRVPVSLNALAHDETITMIDSIIRKGVKVTKVFIDTVGIPEAYQSKLQKMFNLGALGGGGTAGRGYPIDFCVSKKADSLYKCVSAASIAAKVTRDAAMRNWVFNEPALKHITKADADDAEAAAEEAAAVEYEDEEEAADGEMENAAEDEEEKSSEPAAKRARSSAEPVTGVKVVSLHPSAAGSGYPGDPLTKAWMQQHMDKVFGWPDVVRFSWAPAKDALAASGVPCEWPAEAEEKDKQAKLSAFFITAPTPSSKGRLPTLKAKSSWLRKRMIEPVTVL